MSEVEYRVVVLENRLARLERRARARRLVWSLAGGVLAQVVANALCHAMFR